MQTKPKVNSAITHAVDGSRITFTVIGAGTVTLDMSDLAPEITMRAALHGMIQRISDAAAMSRTDDDGKIIPEAERAKAKLEAMTKLVQHYESGTSEWSRVAEGGPRGGILFRALSRMYPEKTPEQVRTFLDGLSKKQQRALRASDKVREVIRAIEAETPADTTIDADTLLNRLNADPADDAMNSPTDDE